MTKLIIVVGFLVAFSAGLVVGIESRQSPSPGPVAPTTGGTTGRSQRSWWVNELNLTPQQQEQMAKIWADVARRGGREQEARRRQCRRDREQAIAALVPEADRSKYDKVVRDYSEQMQTLDREWRSAYQTAVERTKQILTPGQRDKYEAILRRHAWDRGSRGGRDMEHGRQGGDRATSRPVSDRLK